MMTESIQLTFARPDVAVLTFDMPEKSANVLSAGILDELQSHLDPLASRDSLTGLIIRSAKPHSFIVGADLREIDQSLDQPRSEKVQFCRRGQQLFNRLSELPFPSVALVHGICLGGGAELPSWCDFRLLIEHPKSQVGFPEINLGLIPGWGGTARLPRLIGLGRAIDMIATGRSAAAEAAVDMGWADRQVTADTAIDAALDVIDHARHTSTYLELRQERQQPVEVPKSLVLPDAPPSPDDARSRKDVVKVIHDLMIRSAQVDAHQACILEAETMSDLFGSQINRALLHTFFLTDRAKRKTSSRGVEPGTIRSILPLGEAASLVSRSDLFQSKGIEFLAERAQSSSPTADHCQLVVVGQNTVETLQQHREWLASLGGPGWVIALEAGQGLDEAQMRQLVSEEICCGVHFPCWPAGSIVELVPTDATNPGVLATLTSLIKKIGLMPVRLDNATPGLVADSLMVAYTVRGVILRLAGVDSSLKRAAEQFGFRQDPLSMIHECGAARWKGACRTAGALPERLIDAIAQALAPSETSDPGATQERSDNEEFWQHLGSSLEHEMGDLPAWAALRLPAREWDTHELGLCLTSAMWHAAQRLLQQGTVTDPRDLDFVSIHAVGFPEEKGGIDYYVRQDHLPQIQRIEQHFAGGC